MAIDSSIALQARGPQFDDPLTVRARQAQLSDLALQRQAREMQIQGAQREQQDQMTLADLYRSAGNDPQALIQGMAQRGLGSRIPAFQEGQAKLGKTTTEAEAAKLKLAKDKLDIINSQWSALASNPQATHQDAINTITALVSQGIIDQAHGAQMVQQLPGNQGMLKQFLIQKGLEGMEASKRIELLLPKTDIRNMGGSDQQFTTDQLTGQVTPGAQFGKTATPDSLMADARARSEGAANRGVQMRGQDLTAQASANTLALNAQKPASGQATEDERKSAGYAVRMEDALRTLSAVEKTNPKATQPGVGTSLTNMLPEGVANYIRPEDRQRVEAAQLDALDAALTLATGAAYTKEQLKGLSRAYFAQPGDGDTTKTEKAERLRTVIETARVRAGRAEGTVNPILERTGPNAPSSGPKAGTVEDGYVFMGGNPSDSKNWKKK